ncbi:acetyl-CoA synthetase-like protein [Exidia glandulosa HHB12029]|uniref:Acetyl-CoA synthetase-like protein n=1 Tax=Exidia glandulosa HHB12029 TaxID=1314781 RepID=A0A165GL93_EXIGL|nr:acetyl-CoA synthetase-like protein [Exidia glandulosa HHB12029]
MIAQNSPSGFITQQAQHVPLFTLPPLDKSLAFAEFVDWHMVHSGDHTLVQLVRADSQLTEKVTMRDFGRAVHLLGRHFIDRIRPEPRGPTVVAIKMSAHLLLYHTTVSALLRTGFQPFAIAMSMPEHSTRHLLAESNAQYLITIGNSGTPMVQAVVNLGHPEDAHDLSVMSLSVLYPNLTGSVSVGAATEVATLPCLHKLCSWMESYAYDDLPTFVGHTSGSTGLPKAIPFRQKALLSWLICPWFGDLDLGGQVLPVGFLPPHHITTVAAVVLFPMASGMILAMDHPSSPQTPTTPTGILDFCQRAKVDLAVFPPILYESWAHDLNAVKYLSSLNLALVGMGALDSKVGDKLVEAGVPLVPGYGCTEGSQVSPFRRFVPDKDWPYVTIIPYVSHRLVPVGLRRYRLELMENDIYSPAVFNADKGSVYNTHDILERHPTRPDLYRVVERDDNQVKLATGELVPVEQIETAVRQCPEVKQATAFGQGRHQVGILVEPCDDHYRSGEGLLAFIQVLRPYIVNANDTVPTYARVPTDLIVVIPPGTSIPISPKGIVPRQIAVKTFASQIDDAYNSIASLRSRFATPETWTAESVHSFVADVVSTVICKLVSNRVLDEDADLFDQGCNSLHCAHICDALAQAVTTQGRPRSSVPSNSVYLYPTVRSLAAFVYSGEANVFTSRGSAGALPLMARLVDEYTAGLPSRAPDMDAVEALAESGQVVLMTGSTGALGTFVLAELLLDPFVTTVYCVVRQANGLSQQVAAFIDRGLNPDDLPLSKLRIIHGDVSQERFGFGKPEWEQLTSACTAIVHCAWRLDFNLGVESFKTHIAGVRALIDIALASTRPVPPHLVFMSSIDTVHAWNTAHTWKEQRFVPNSLLDVAHALGSGYGESKWVAERILEKAAETSGLRVTSLRLSQLSGATTNGAWNATDWVPLILRAGLEIGALPVYQPGTTSWLPLDIAAKASVAVMRAPAAGFRVVNVGNPNPTSWETVLQELATATSQYLDRPILPMKSTEWAARIKQLSEDTTAYASREENPMLHIAEFLTGWCGERWYEEDSPFNDALGIPRLDTSSICEIYPELVHCAKVGCEDVVRWVDYWGKHGLFAAAG